MNKLKLNTNPAVKDVFNNYPTTVKPKIDYLRSLILETANELKLGSLEETLKWGEPSNIAKKGSTIRIDWKEKTPNQYAMYFSCSTKLVPTFRVVYQNTFQFEGKRAIVFNLEDEIPIEALKNCIKVALTYKNVKHLPLLGM